MSAFYLLLAEPLSNEQIFAIIGVVVMIAFAFIVGHALRRRRIKAISKMAEELITEPAADAIPLEIVAAITAALQAYMDSERPGSASGYVVRSIRRVPAWNNAARYEQQRRLV